MEVVFKGIMVSTADYHVVINIINQTCLVKYIHILNTLDICLCIQLLVRRVQVSILLFRNMFIFKGVEGI